MSAADDARPRHPVDRSLELLVYLPLGFALEARQLYPRFVDRGRNQILLARVMGKFATRQLSELAGDRLDRTAPPGTEALRLLGLLPYRSTGPADAPAPAPEAQAPPSEAASEVAPETAPPAPEPTPAADPAPDVASLAIPDYDSLAASQVVPRLDGLAVDELEAVRRYEAAGRGRKTILSKIAQLQAP